MSTKASAHVFSSLLCSAIPTKTFWMHALRVLCSVPHVQELLLDSRQLCRSLVTIVGAKCPARWLEALQFLDRSNAERSDVCWLLVRHNWRLLTDLVHCDPSGVAYACLKASSAPHHVVYALQPKFTVMSRCSTGDTIEEFAHLLAQGFHLAQIDLTPLLRKSQKYMDWRSGIQVFQQVPISEAQRVAMKLLARDRRCWESALNLLLYPMRSNEKILTGTVAIGLGIQPTWEYCLRWVSVAHDLGWVPTLPACTTLLAIDCAARSNGFLLALLNRLRAKSGVKEIAFSPL
jgi:hypothetical protein